VGMGGSIKKPSGNASGKKNNSNSLLLEGKESKDKRLCHCKRNSIAIGLWNMSN
jgi:hypothetical protein